MILLTGGSGFIGGHFHNVISNDKLINLDLHKPEFNHSATFYQGDIRKQEDVERVLSENKIEKIISLAAKHHDFGIGHDEYFDTNEAGTEVICKAASKYGIKEIIFYSTVAVYGTTEQMSTEQLEPQPDSPYGASKLAGEKVLIKWAQEDASRKVLILRPALVFGANNRANMYNLISQVNSGFYFHIGKAANIKSIAYVENLVSATLFLANKLGAGVHIYNYADEPQLTSRQIGETIAEALEKKIRFTLPRFVAIACGLPFDLAIKITGKNLPISTARIKKLNTQTLHSANKVRQTGFLPVYSTQQGIMKMVSWYKSQR
ncbi:NAD(P)-dependent oxidoreductase [Chryseotalea sanaruensis]|uniref:NAD(P)-dependent oxidoreductase n=1 Tax=Chryseotalea sanaruensis TaxID=2482724 RepID=A0A401UC40_9BACT|nr:NAD(P)-dependent oxidoreductase [Chryseotalea sanaruensis]GCC52471.1 NAD(P)-dependent oxidoreductase [Chryseotalea sanaruensis]